VNRCANCGGVNVVVGEAGEPSKCAACGWTKFYHVRETALASVHTFSNPIREMRIVPHVGVSPERAHALFSKIHEAIDEA
jgi:predicted  nucleic acid-binding Zn-ribbon protein